MANLEQIFTKLEGVDGKVDELLVWKAVIDERCKSHREQTNELRETIFANSKGLKFKVERLCNNKKDTIKQKDFWFSILRTVIAYGIIGVLVWLLMIYKTI